MRKSTTALLALIATLAAAATAQADTIPISTLLTDFNLIDNGNFASSSEVIGPVLINGDLSVANSVILNSSVPTVVPLPIPVAGLAEVNVFGNVVGATVPGLATVGAGSVVLIGSHNPTPPSTVMATFPGSAATSVLSGNSFPVTFASIWAQLNGTTGLSHTLDGLTANGTNPSAGSGTFSCPGCSGSLVWQISATDLMNLSAALVFPSCLQGPTPSCDGVVNVTGGSFSTTQGFNTPFALQGLIFNFETATSVTVSNAFEASILAPDANLQSSAFIEGNVVVDSAGSTAPLGGELHYFPFDCSDNLCTTTPVPEPGSLALLGAALASFAALAFFPAMRGRRG
jgi:choice-of-anchor A domain-containing protein